MRGNLEVSCSLSASGSLIQMQCEDGVRLHISYVILFYLRGIYQRRDAIEEGSVASTCPLFPVGCTQRAQSLLDNFLVARCRIIAVSIIKWEIMKSAPVYSNSIESKKMVMRTVMERLSGPRSEVKAQIRQQGLRYVWRPLGWCLFYRLRRILTND